MKKTINYSRPAMKQVRMQPKGIVCDGGITGSGTGFIFDESPQQSEAAEEIQKLLDE